MKRYINVRKIRVWSVRKRGHIEQTKQKEFDLEFFLRKSRWLLSWNDAAILKFEFITESQKSLPVLLVDLFIFQSLQAMKS